MSEINKKNQKINNIIFLGLWIIAIVYSIAVAKIILFKYGFTPQIREVSLSPFEFMRDFYRAETSIDILLKNTLGNIAIFIPMGILIPALRKSSDAKKTIVIGFLTSLGIEIFQYIFALGAMDIDDLILNTLGVVLGCLIYFKVLKKLDKKAKNKIATLGFLSLFGIGGVVSLWLYQPNMLPSQTEVVNEAVLGELDPSSANVEGVCTNVAGDLLTARVYTYDVDGKIKDKIEQQYNINETTKFYMKNIGAKYSPNGNVQKIIVTYDQITKEQLKEKIGCDGIHANLWVDDNNKCCDVLIWTHDESE